MKINEVKRAGKEVHFGSGTSYHIKIKSEVLPFVMGNMDYKKIEKADEILQKFISLVEKKFDAIWYIGTDYLGSQMFERFMFQHGGFMEISLNGEINCYFYEDKIKRFERALLYAIGKLSSKGSAMHIVKHAKVGKKLISLENSIKI
jgi:predicted AlkP superfamily pyrophosphatase or phosphodiesterase